MKTKAVDSIAILTEVEMLRAEADRLAERVAALETAIEEERAAAAQAQATQSPAEEEGLAEELVSVLSAALAAYLGVKPHIRQIRLIDSASWAQQGRVTMQAAHLLSVRRG
jgi:methylmalonyl-CoA carboxyltransferase large subunit